MRSPLYILDGRYFVFSARVVIWCDSFMLSSHADMTDSITIIKITASELNPTVFI